jgi:hypothetical protein
METNRRLIAVLILLALLLTGLFYFQQAEQNKKSGSSIYSQDAGSLSVFAKLLDRRGEGKLRIYRTAFLDNMQLDSTSTLMIFSPKFEISTREAKIVGDFVRAGGKLYLSAKDIADQENLSTIFHELKLDAEIKTKPFPQYKKGEVVTFDRTFYSYYQFDSCVPTSADCFHRVYPIGGATAAVGQHSGEVHYFLGLMPLSNALLSYAGNQEFALQLAINSPTVIIDEYHHFFSDKRFYDFILDLSVSAPLIGIFLLLLLLFLLGYYPALDQRLIERSQSSALSFHQLNQGLVCSALSNISPTDLSPTKIQLQFLERILGSEVAELALSNFSTKNYLQRGKEIILFHQKVLKNRRSSKTPNILKGESSNVKTSSSISSR